MAKDADSHAETRNEIAKLMADRMCSPREGQEALEFFIELDERHARGEIDEATAALEAKRFTVAQIRRRFRN